MNNSEAHFDSHSFAKDMVHAIGDICHEHSANVRNIIGAPVSDDWLHDQPHAVVAIIIDETLADGNIHHAIHAFSKVLRETARIQRQLVSEAGEQLTDANKHEYPAWEWIASIALIGRGYEVADVNNLNVAEQANAVQTDYALPNTSKIDPTTWMTLFTSKGDPNRPARACDTRFEITSELLTHLVNDGYEIVGRYLSEPGQADKDPADYFKAIRPGELQRIVDGGLKYFPIFQEYSTELRHFTAETGARHATEALTKAKELGIPPTIFYFAVDFDAIDHQVDTNILPYFEAIHARMRDGYTAGIYGARNICTRVMDAGYAGSAFVSDMSTGFSGNLGYPIPREWNYDQFHEIHGYQGEWDLDKVAWSGRHAPCDTVLRPGDTAPQPPKTSYTLPPQANSQRLQELPHISEAFPLLRQLEDIAIEYERATSPGLVNAYHSMLNYLSKPYLTDDRLFDWAVEPYDDKFGEYVDSKYPTVAKQLDRFVGNLSGSRIEAKDNIGGVIDVPHVTVAALAYAPTGLSPSHWPGWGGDLASGMKNIYQTMVLNPGLDTSAVANSIIGADALTANYLHGANLDEIGIDCNFSDLCSDADAIFVGQLYHDLNGAGGGQRGEFTDAIVAYYEALSQRHRFKHYELDLGAHTTLAGWKSAVQEKMFGLLENTKWTLMRFAGDSTYEQRVAACDAFASYIWAALQG